MDSLDALRSTGRLLPQPEEAALRDVGEVQEAYATHFAAVWRYLALMTQNPAEAEDIASDVFERAVAAFPGAGHPKGGWLPWLLLVARRRLISRWRRQRILKLVPITRLASPPNPDRVFDDVELRLWLEEITAALPVRQREALFLRYVEDLDDQVVARILGISPSGVRSLSSRAVAALRQRDDLWR